MRAPRSKASVGILLVATALFMMALSAEILVRIFHAYKQHSVVYFWKRPGRWDFNVADKEFGWTAKGNLSYRERQKTYDKVPYEVVYETDEHGMRSATVVGPGRPTIFIVGDSFTHAVDASNNRLYYNILGNKLNVNTYAHAVASFGTVQEYLALKKFLPSIRPDLVIWQLCSNDFVNNSFELEKASVTMNTRRRRPYLIDGEIMYRKPYSALRGAFDIVPLSIRFPHTAMGLMDRVAARYSKGSVEDTIEKKSTNHPGFRQSVAATEETLRRGKDLLGDIPLVLFSVDEYQEPYQTQFVEIAKRLELPLTLSQLPTSDKEPRYYASDGSHWSEEGHRVVGENLARQLLELEDLHLLSRF